jgi:hypothetical protein
MATWPRAGETGASAFWCCRSREEGVVGDEAMMLTTGV